MGTISHIFKRDARLLDEAKKEFPESPAFAEYLALRVKEAKGSLEVIRIICKHLKMGVADPDPVPMLTVIRLAVEKDPKLTTRVYFELPKHGVNSLGLSLTLGMQLSGTVHFDGAKEAGECTASVNQAVDRDYMNDYARIFICALAMLKGLEMDPREEAA